MSATTSLISTNTIPLPPAQSVAQELAWRLVQVNANADAILKLFSDNATFRWLPDSTVLNRKQFAKVLQEGNIDNITQIGDWSDHFWARVGSDAVIWSAKGFQHRLGQGMDEDGEGWYELDQTIQLLFSEVEGELKIREFISESYTKTKLDRQVQPLPRSQSLAHELAFRSFQIPQQNKALLALYSDTGQVVYQDGGKQDMDSFAKMMRQANTDNVLRIGSWSNRYHSTPDDPEVVLWTAKGYQKRLGKGDKENGEGWYGIRQTVRLSFTQDGDTPRIMEQHEITYRKKKVD